MIAAGPLLILCVIAALVCGAHAYRAVAGHMLRMSSSSTVSPVITRIDDDADVYRAAQLSIGVFFPEEASKIGGMKFKNPLKENMYKKLFRQHLQELNGRVSKPNCILLKATDGESEDVLGFVEMFMAACIVEEDDDYAGESAGENKDQGVESDVNAHLDNINTDLTTGTHSLNDKNKNKDIVSFASPKEVNSARASSRTIVYVMRIDMFMFRGLYHCSIGVIFLLLHYKTLTFFYHTLQQH